MAAAKKKPISTPAKSTKSVPVTTADIARELQKDKAYRSPDPYFRGSKTGEMRVSKKSFVDNMFAESNGVKAKGKMISAEDPRFKAAAKMVAAAKWDSMNNYYKASGTKPNRVSSEQNKQFLAERDMREKAARQKKK